MKMDEYNNLYLGLRRPVRSLRLRIIDTESQHQLGEWLVPLPAIAIEAIDRYGAMVTVIPDPAEPAPEPVPAQGITEVSAQARPVINATVQAYTQDGTIARARLFDDGAALLVIEGHVTLYATLNTQQRHEFGGLLLTPEPP